MDGEAIIYCKGAFNTPGGKTAHGLVRLTHRYKVLSVIDPACAGKDAAWILDDIPEGIPVYESVEEGFEAAKRKGETPSYLVIGIAPDGGSLNSVMKEDIIKAMELGLNVDSGLHDYLTEDHDILRAAILNHVRIRDIRKPPARNELHFFSGKIHRVSSYRIAVLGTDSSTGKRTTAWILVQRLNAMGIRTELIGTSQTAWMQGVRYGVIMDCLVNDSIPGEIEHAVYSCWEQEHPEIMIIEGQGSLLNPANPGGFEILASARPDVIVLQHAPRRKEYHGLPGYRIEPLGHQVEALQVVSGRKVAAITLNHEHMTREKLAIEKERILRETGLPSCDLLWESGNELFDLIAGLMHQKMHHVG